MDEPVIAEAANPKKRKRSGKEREIRKAAAIAAAAATAEQQDDAVGSAGADTVELNSDAEDVNEPMDMDALGDAEGQEPTQMGEEEVAEPKSEVDIDQVRKRIPQGLKSLLPVLKKAKTSETQRLIKKLRFLRKKLEDAAEGDEGKMKGTKQEVADLEQQLDILKRLDLHNLLQPLLSLKLRKHPRLKPLLPLPSGIFPSSSLPTSSASSTVQIKVENRLYSSKPTSDSIISITNWVVGNEGATLNLKNAAKRAEAAKVKKAIKIDPARAALYKLDDEELEELEAGGNDESEEEEGDEMDVDFDPKKAIAQAEAEGEEEDAAADAAGWESGSLGGEDDGDEEEDSDAEDESDEEEEEDDEDVAIERVTEDDPHPPQKRQRQISPPPAEPPVPTASSTTKTAKEKPEPQAARPSTAVITSSLFLPSLKSGFTMGDYDSDPEEDERRDKKTGKLKPLERKNRRGQQERRRIAELKYGQNANHVKKAKTDEGKAKLDNQARQFLANQTGAPMTKAGKGQVAIAGDGGWTARAAKTGSAASVPTSAPTPASKPWEKSNNAAPKAFASQAPTPGAKTAPSGDDKPKALHPSWEAAKLRKQKESMMGMNPGAGAAKPKKIVFD